MMATRRRRTETEDQPVIEEPTAFMTDDVMTVPDTPPAPIEVEDVPEEPAQQMYEVVDSPVPPGATPHTLMMRHFKDIPEGCPPTLVETRSGFCLIDAPFTAVEDAWREMRREFPEVSGEDFAGMLRGALGSLGRWRVISRVNLK